MVLQEMIETLSLTVESKASTRELQQTQEATAIRLTNIENAIMKGLKAVSDKAAHALSLKVSIEVRTSSSLLSVHKTLARMELVRPAGICQSQLRLVIGHVITMRGLHREIDKSKIQEVLRVHLLVDDITIMDANCPS